MKKLYILLIVGIMLSGIAIAGVTISRDIIVDKTTKDIYTEMGISNVTTSSMDNYGNVKVFNGKTEIFQVNVPLRYCSEWTKDICSNWIDYTTAELEDMVVEEVSSGLEKLRVGYVEKKAEGTKPSLIDGGIITIRQK